MRRDFGAHDRRIDPRNVDRPRDTGHRTRCDFGLTWEWLDFTSPVEKVVAAAPERYTVQFGRDGSIALRADCNRGTGTVAYLPDRRLELKPIAMTRAMCPPDSQSDRFVKEVGRATSYFIRNGELYMELPMDSGVLRFRRGYATPDPTQPQVEPPPG